MVVQVAKNPGGRYKWRVQIGAGRGARVYSRHRLKTRAMEQARALARDRGDVLEAQMQWGGWKHIASY